MSWGPGRRGLSDLRQGGRPSSSVSEGICHFNDVIFLARSCPQQHQGASCLPE